MPLHRLLPKKGWLTAYCSSCLALSPFEATKRCRALPAWFWALARGSSAGLLRTPHPHPSAYPLCPTCSACRPAFWLMGNLGRAGYLKSTGGMWPYTYNT